MKYLLLTFIFLCFSSAPASAALDDGDEFPGPALHAAMPLEIEKLTISVSESRIQYTYMIVNPAELTVQLSFTFALPPYEWTGTHRDAYRNGYRNMDVTVDDKKVALERSVQAFVNGKDIAPLLLGMNIDPIFEGIIAFSKEHQDIIESNPELTALGYLQKICEDDCDNPENFYFVPQWATAATYSFTHEFRPKSSTVIQYEYEPIWGQVVGPLGDTAAWEVTRIGGVFSDAFNALGSKFDYAYSTKWLTLPVSSLGAKRLPENVSVAINIAADGPQFIYAVLGAHNASGKTSVPITITSEPVGGPLKILLLHKLPSRKTK